MTTFILTNRKGGCGKTTTAVNLAAYLSEACPVLLIDLDPQAQATISLGVFPYRLTTSVYQVINGQASVAEAALPTPLPNLHLLPASHDLAASEIELAGIQGREFRLRDALADLRYYRFILIDCPPSLGLLTLNGLAAAQRVLVPLQAQFLALEGLAQQMQTIYRVTSELNPELRLEGVIPTMVDAQTRLARSVISDVESNFGAERLLPSIRMDVKAAEAPSFGQPLLQYAPRSRAAEDYRRLAHALMDRHEPKITRPGHGARRPVQAL